MIVTYLRSSSISKFKFCEMQYFIDYVLGWKFPVGKKAEQGTIVHKTLECLALSKIAISSGRDYIEDSELGVIKFDPIKWIEPRILTKKEIDKINKTRSNRNIFISDSLLKYGSIRLGEDVVNKFFDAAYKFYSNRSTHNWVNIDREHCLNWVWIALEHQQGAFDPRLRNIVDVEREFDIEMREKWASFAYLMPDGKENKGRLRIRGTIDLITQISDNTYEIVDWKTGRRMDWSTMKEKDANYLKTDTQLLLYFYAVKTLFPTKNIIMTMFFIRDGGPISVLFDDDDFAVAKNMLMREFSLIRDNNRPAMVDANQSSFKCKKLCPYYKNSFDGCEENMCNTVSREIDEFGIDYVTYSRSRTGFDVSHYEAPGT